ncbi:putative transcription factor C2H2 family [Rosa chinensis]|uniref:Putative transcription factor C2H2 family n=1 Tax=Rosa chinensis TaxID=74649 RepID=A0A2P6PQL9_ROSCH|nr:putative transcription factor C2H2 family [Rosa chinensis]
MGLLGLVGFALQCFVVLAWPLFALVYPLYSSIRAIETDSITDTHKINTYWVVFSLILLFEHAFMKLLEWFLLWPYIRLLIVFFLVMPHFDGALYVYQHLIFPCLSMDPQTVINLFSKRKESLVRDNFLSEVERYVKENGPEGLEKFIACKSTRTNLNVKEFNAVSSMDNEASKSIKPNGGQNDIKAVQEMVKKKETTASQVSQAEPNLTVNEDKFSSRKMNEKVIEVAADREILKTSPPKKVQKEWTSVNPLQTQTDATLTSLLGDNKHEGTYEALKIKNEAELTGPENRTVAAMEINEKLVEVGTGIEDPESPKEVQKEWTCALCQVTTTCERNLNSHLRGRKHKAAYEALKGNQAFVPNIAPASTAKTSNQPNKEPGKSIPKKMEMKMKMKMCKARKIVVQLQSHRSNPAMARKGSKQKVTLNENVQGQKNSSPAPITKKQSSNGQKGKIAIQVEKVQSQQPKPNEVPRVKSSPLWCAICRIRCAGEIDMLSHLNGRKHKENVQERKKRT